MINPRNVRDIDDIINALGDIAYYIRDLEAGRTRAEESVSTEQDRILELEEEIRKLKEDKDE